MKSVWLVMDNKDDSGQESVKAILKTKDEAKLFLADYVLENETETYYLDLFEMELS